MKLTHRMEDKICMVTFMGNLALDSIDEVKEYVRPLLEDSKIHGFVFNCEKVNLIDSNGVGFIISTFKTVQSRHLKFIVCHLSKKNIDIFRMLSLDKIMVISPTEEEALSQIRKSLSE